MLFRAGATDLEKRVPADPLGVRHMSLSNRVFIKGEVLNTSKEIAEYLDRGIRTVQRWERDLKLPVRRLRGRRRSAVLNIPKEFDARLGCCPQTSLPAQESSIPFHEVISPARAPASSPGLPCSQGLSPEPL